MKIDPDANRWFALEVDLEYPTELHNLHNDYPLAVEKKVCAEGGAITLQPGFP